MSRRHSVNRLLGLHRGRQTKVGTRMVWLENTPDTPKPRTLEDVVRDYLTTTFDRRPELEKEMKEILEKGLDNQDS